MDSEAIIQSLKDKLGPFLLPIGIAFIGLLLIGYGLITSFSNNDSSDITFEKGSESSQQVLDATAKTVSAETIMVDVSGAIVKPGVYQLGVDSRLQDAVLKAGGFAADADREEIARAINLAAKVTDGEKIYIPFSGQIVGAGSGQQVKISLNKGSSSEIDQLPGVGPVTAEKIIANRPYGKVEDLLNKKVVTQSVFDKIKEKISL